jgi:FlaA1/EpsC-like NDP-sugar epimerase
MRDGILLAAANTCGSALAVLGLAAGTGARFSFSILVLEWLLCQFLILGVRVAVRARSELARGHGGEGCRRVLIYGAGRAGLALLREIRDGGELRYEVAGFLDDDPLKAGSLVQMAPVLGNGGALAGLVRPHSIHEVLIAIPSATPAARRRIFESARVAGVSCKSIPTLAELVTGRCRLPQLRDVEPDELLGRPAVRLDGPKIERKLAGSAVMVTGAGGSIGSELCRHIARWRPEVIVALDRSENYLFDLDGEMRSLYPGVNFLPCLGDILDAPRVRELMVRHRIRTIFHAAAYKHVPMVENSVFEAVVNNAVGTWQLAGLASQCGVEDFVLISSDKAVRPTNMMGATKRLAELFIRAHQSEVPRRGGCRFIAVRFGNVLGSNGSVVPLFKQQIAAGGPVTVTDPEMYRYFMTIPEAAQLVLQAAAMGKGGEVFVLEMGQPVRILDLAQTLIELSGLQPGKDIEIAFCGPRPGEKLREELSAGEECMLPTAHEKIHVFAGPSGDFAAMTRLADELRQACKQRNLAELLLRVRSVVTEYAPSPEILRQCRPETSGEERVAGSLAKLSRAVGGNGNHPGRMERGEVANASSGALG